MKKMWYWIVASVSLLSFVGAYYWYTQQVDHIILYNAQRDRAEVLDIFEQNWYWLTSQSRQEGYSPEYRFDNLLSSDNPSYAKPLQVYVYRLDKQVAGFITLYKENFFSGKILHLGVDRSYRKRGIATALVNFALRKIKSMGCTQAVLVTRVNNTRARNLYTKLGFVETGIQGDFVDFVYTY